LGQGLDDGDGLAVIRQHDLFPALTVLMIFESR